ncbi:C2H2-type zinc finger family protein [Striga hermonthica]|uniref:C2H2-type zinc finger family protein n=1 Tax=Striga hermonthica TaxID=68872 RepID=A0A9N7P0F8_STRHE|nr:C2H2-type zinc finger family protein [Striga hermonthica]
MGDQNCEQQITKHSYFLRAKGPRASPLNNELVSDNEEEEDLASCLVMLSNHQPGKKGPAFQCKACKKIFASHQALGGHRASHKKVKGCFAARPESGGDSGRVEDGFLRVARPAKRTEKMHECSVCRRVFTSGQALGGHKRSHWLTTNSADNAFVTSFQYDDDDDDDDRHKTVFLHAPDRDRQLDLNLNLPAAPENKGPNGLERNKVRRLSDLRDVKYGGGWLQMGIASSAEF